MTLNLDQELSTHHQPPVIILDNQSINTSSHNIIMASKRKSTVPCMIPSKTKHVREEIVLGCLPELLPTIPEDSILSISGEAAGHFCHDSSRPKGGDRWYKGGAYSCQPCCFESRDLNSFLDHLHNCHADFRAQPSFYCLNCGVSVARFEALALHNAKAHPGLIRGSVHGSLHVKKRDQITTVEQSLFTDNGDVLCESGISLTKTPIARMMKTKGEHKKIVVSHTVEVRRIDTGKEIDPKMLTNVPELQNGALRVTDSPAVPKTSVTHVITTTPSQPFHKNTPSLYSLPSSDSSKNLPKVMIPLSSIPTYDAAMDTSSFLKTSFGKFPYPSKAELCYLTVVSDFPEEQIKLWFTAQRLKQGISWSPEEIEEAKRKMFNTVFQTEEPQKHPSKQRHANHIVSHHTITAQPTPVGPNYQMANLLHGSVLGRQTRVIASQAGMAGGQQVTRVSYTAPATPPTVVRTSHALTKNIVPTLETDKSVGLGLDIAGGSSCVVSTSNRSNSSSSSCSSSSSISSYFSSSSNGGEHGTRTSMNNSGLSNSIVGCSTVVSNTNNCGSDNESRQNSNVDSIPSILEGFSSNKSKVIINTSKSNIICHSNTSVSNLDTFPLTQADDDKTNNCIHHKTNNGSVSGDYSSTSNNGSVPNLNHASNAQHDNTSTTVITKNSSSISIIEEGKCIQEFPIKGMSILQQLIKKEDEVEMDKTRTGLKVDPIKINRRRLKVNEFDITPGLETTTPELKPDCPQTAMSPQPSFSAAWGNKSPQQVHLLRQTFSSTRWPSSQQYEELSVMTGLPKSEVVRWFSDSRYIHKNGQLQWLESYQRPPAGLKEANSFTDLDLDALKDPQTVHKKLAKEDVSKQLDEEPVQRSTVQRGVWRDTYTPLLSLVDSVETGDRGRAGQTVESGALQEHWVESEDKHQQPVTGQAFVEATDGSQDRDRLRTELLEV
ncbi:zinc fingers and homeoboxes protein 3 [Osmerus eperlanus]|uniref:zinc fingers and homeoboxes protein 3 n=1 Tax=Osmerus eperlanus TaxID=29151 RepID=UPI002E12AE24